ncbi:MULTISPECIES: multidrug efflux RND transporter permease subunit [Sphingomonadales]|uniref:Efflux pump membrane transporter n=1 Tax=Rhizorhabdus wittichii (strain DSM 6014 / CCUG 31198 / JCM 15750 / NBRC 105917 / EY 4224 / RW1) TaxID=392499 RepID=A0A9J9LCD3_RHIWR|nr:transporter, hydrophobe/amphiphile efflux-1 (HAE1) family [Rhizorhabdus wittichii RW1]ARR54800.1 multidrug efflux RND transporter permease subunit [Rhizorhabdus wittichii DC-6]
MPRFFIDRPVFAWVIAIVIVLMGLIAIPQLPIERYPTIAPPSITITATYPGATPRTMNDSVVGLIERELSSVKNLLYFESSTDTSGVAQITATFKPGTDPELAQVDVQNRLKTAEPRLPQVVRQTGVFVEAASSGFLVMIAIESKDPHVDPGVLGDYAARNVSEELKRVPGVGRVQLFTSERAMRVWIDPAKLLSYSLTMSDVNAAIAAQNAQIAPGAIGSEPTVGEQRVTIPLTVDGQLQTPEEFRQIVLRANSDGSSVLLGDVARVELASQSFAASARTNGRPTAILAVQLAPGANAVATSRGVLERMDELSKSMPDGISYSVPFDTAPFVKISIEKVVETLAEAMVLVFLVMFLFLQKFRYTLVPAIVAPIALLGTLSVMLVAGFSVNVLTMFGMVLAIGIIVDDAIVVVENVERLMAEEGLSPRDATRKAMREITGAIIGITLVLTAVFIPMAFASGSVGAIYRQFTISMAVSILFSAFLALSLTPALCATILKPVHGHEEKRGFFGWFDRKFDALAGGYQGWIARLLKRTGRMMASFAVVLVLLGVGFMNLPSAFLPEEDQGFYITAFQMPADATISRTSEAVSVLERHNKSRPAVRDTTAVQGFGFSGSGANAALVFTMLKDWKDRDGATAQSEVASAQQATGAIREGVVMSLLPPSIEGLGNSSGFSLRLQDRAGKGDAALAAAQGQLLGLAAQSKVLQGVYPEGLPPGSSVKLEIDRRKAQTLGVSFSDIASTLSGAIGSTYINDFPNRGRLQQVIVQAEAASRMKLDDVLNLYVRNAAGDPVRLGEVVNPHWEVTPLQLVRYNGYPTMRISGSAAPGYSSGAAMKEMERLAAELPPGFAIEWTGQSLQEKQAGDEALMLLGLSMFVVFLVLAALYESWAIPLSVIMVVPLGLLGALAAVMVAGLSNDVFFKVGLITIIGLSAKNAILIVEFAKAARDEGMSTIEATIHAARLRLRPIIMTSLAFTLGVMPLMLATGASKETQRAIGTGVFGGMISATLLAIFFVPVFFVVMMKLVERYKKRKPAVEE